MNVSHSASAVLSTVFTYQSGYLSLRKPLDEDSEVFIHPSQRAMQCIDTKPQKNCFSYPHEWLWKEMQLVFQRASTQRAEISIRHRGKTTDVSNWSHTIRYGTNGSARTKGLGAWSRRRNYLFFFKTSTDAIFGCFCCSFIRLSISEVNLCIMVPSSCSQGTRRTEGEGDE